MKWDWSTLTRQWTYTNNDQAKQKIIYATNAKNKHLSSLNMNKSELELEQSKAIILNKVVNQVKY
jgi:hypothetical protein